MDSNTLARSMRFSVAEGGLATAMGSLFSGVFLTGFALAIGATDVQIGLLMTLPSFCGVMQFAGSYWIERYGENRLLCLWTTAAARALYLPMLLIALLATGLSPQAKVWWIIGVMALSSVLGSIGGLAWLSWIRSLVPEPVRVSFLGRRNLVNSALTLILCLAAGLVVGNGHDGRIGGYLLVFVAAMLCGWASSVLLAKIPAGSMAHVSRGSTPWLHTLAEPLHEPNFRRIMLFYAAWNMAANLSIPFFTVFYLRNLGLPMWYVVVLNTLTSLMGLAGNNLWTRLAERYGMKPVVLLATIGDALYPLCLVFIGVHWIWALVLVHCYGIFSNPITIGPDNLVMKLSPDRNNSSFIAVFKAVFGMSALLAAVFGGWLAQSPLLAGATGGATVIDGLKIVFLISFVGRVASLALLVGVAEPGAVPVRDVVLSWLPVWLLPSDRAWTAQGEALTPSPVHRHLPERLMPPSAAPGFAGAMEFDLAEMGSAETPLAL